MEEQTITEFKTLKERSAKTNLYSYFGQVIDLFLQLSACGLNW